LKSAHVRLRQAVAQRITHHRANRRWQKLTAGVVESTPLSSDLRPVVFFNASTRLQAMSLNAAFSLLSALGVRTQGVPVILFACKRGMTRCVLGSNRDQFETTPPCEACVRQSRAVFTNLPTRWFEYEEDHALNEQIADLSVTQLQAVEHQGVPLGAFALNSLRWMLRRHTLADDGSTRAFFHAYILSAWNVYRQAKLLLQDVNPQAVVLFNGMFFPEAAVRHACVEAGVRVITHEVGLRPMTAFFTDGQATAYPMHIPADFELTPEMEQKLDAYLNARLSGDFTMAGIRFWPEMQRLSPEFTEKARRFKHIVPVFTNVIFDTSQVHANTIFSDMFAWLEHVRGAAARHPETLFVIRAHPDECRPGKESRESVADWVKQNGVENLPNVVFFDANEYVSSYELIQQAHLVMVYNSTIGLEAALMGKPVLAGGKARFTQLETAYLPQNQQQFQELLEQFLSAPRIETPAIFKRNARRFLYYQLFVTSLEFQDFLEEDGVWKGYVQLRKIQASQLRPENSPTMQIVLDGILNQGGFTAAP